jgi:two-component system sensor histidine kinase ChiS
LSKINIAEGLVDLSDYDFKASGNVNLDCQWEFYWNRLLSPSDFSSGALTVPVEYMKLPGFWNSPADREGSYPGEGVATYRLRVIIPHPDRLMAIQISNSSRLFRLWVNGKRLSQFGTVDTSDEAKKQFSFVYHKTIEFFPEHENEIILQILNYHFESGGLKEPVILGEAGRLRRDQKRDDFIIAIVAGFFLFMGIYNLFVWIYRRKDISPLYFGLFCLTWIVVFVNLNTTILYDSGVSVKTIYFIDTLFCMTLPLYLMLLKSLYPDDFSPLAVKITQVWAFVSFTALLFTNLLFANFKASEQIMDAMYLLNIAFGVYVVAVLLRVVLSGRVEAITLLASGAAIVFTGTNDILYYVFNIGNGYYFHYGLLFFSIFAALLISYRSSRSFTAVENLSLELEEKNIALSGMDRLKDEFLANTSHELRTPLHGIIGISESMLNIPSGDLPGPVKENLSLISSSANRLSHLVNDILDFSRLKHNDLELNLGPVDIYSAAEIVINLSLPLIGGKSLEIINEVERDLPPVHADGNRLKQILHNLIGNAIKFTHNGRIVLSAAVVDGEENGNSMMRIRVEDTGIGIPDDSIDTIFESFQQVDGSDNRAYGGTGLGLAVTKKLVELQNGRITVTSEPDKGSLFSFTLPVSNSIVVQGEENQRREETDHIGQELPDIKTVKEQNLLPELDQSENITFENNPTILVIDDDPVNVKIVQNYLSNKNCEIITAPDGFNALALIADKKPDLLLLDIMMPVISGYEVCRRIREKLSPEELPIIMLTAKNQLSDINAAFEAGANDYITKPFQVRELLSRVHTMLRLRTIQKEAATGISIPDKNNNYYLQFDEIVYISASLNHTIIHTGEEEIVISGILKEIAGRLPDDLFVRIHRQYVINRSYLHNVYHVKSGRYRVTLKDKDKTELPVGDSYLSLLRKKMP